MYGTATRQATGSPAEILTHGASRSFGAAAPIALAALLTAAFAIRARRGAPAAGQNSAL
ncbi:hypothetical protein [Streptomyces griseoruber]|uniref:hypothetical protein n=1 Tax=Streptomyces griseoruber TaxID=1943 RepID=UPI00197DF138|nr:hypothetical protein [Streptomyces griseoruber]